MYACRTRHACPLPVPLVINVYLCTPPNSRPGNPPSHHTSNYSAATCQCGGDSSTRGYDHEHLPPGENCGNASKKKESCCPSHQLDHLASPDPSAHLVLRRESVTRTPTLKVLLRSLARYAVVGAPCSWRGAGVAWQVRSTRRRGEG